MISASAADLIENLSRYYAHVPSIVCAHASLLPSFYFVTRLNLIVHVSWGSSTKRQFFRSSYLYVSDFSTTQAQLINKFTFQNGSLILQCIRVSLCKTAVKLAQCCSRAKSESTPLRGSFPLCRPHSRQTRILKHTNGSPVVITDKKAV